MVCGGDHFYLKFWVKRRFSIWGLKNAKRLFPSKIALCLKKVCYKVSLCENCQRQSCKAFIGLSMCTKMIGGRRPLLRENLADTDPPLAKRRSSIYFRS